MRVATFNVNGVNGRLPVLLAWLKKTAPDIVCLQELKSPDEKFPIAAIREVGYDAIWHGQKSWNGVAILARAVTPRRRGGVCLAILKIFTAAISKPRSTAFWSGAYICPTAIRRLGQNSITNCVGSNDWKSMPERYLIAARP